MSKYHLAILFGGKTVEHDISVISTYATLPAFKQSIYKLYLLYLTKSNNLRLLPLKTTFEDFKYNLIKDKSNVQIIYQNNQTYLKTKTKKIKLDLIYPIVHGNNVESGEISSIINLLNLPNVTCNHLYQAIFQNKHLTKILLTSLSIPTLPYKLYHKDDKIIDYKLPCIVKPLNLGSSIGINIAKDINSLHEALKLSTTYDQDVIIEPLLTNFKEYTQACYTYHGKVISSLIEDIIYDEDIYTYEQKYLHHAFNKTSLHYHHESPIYESINNTTIKLYQACSLNGIIRIDYLYDLDTNQLYVLEINTIPGSLSLHLFDEDPKLIISNVIEQALINHKLQLNPLIPSNLMRQNIKPKN